MNVTLTLDESLVKDARHEAVERGVSFSALVTAALERQLERKKLYRQAKRHSLRMMEEGLDLGGVPLSRDEIHRDRTTPKEPS